MRAALTKLMMLFSTGVELGMQLRAITPSIFKLIAMIATVGAPTTLEMVVCLCCIDLHLILN